MNNKKPIRKMLMVSWPILPGRGGSVIIVEKLVNYFSPDELVLFGELPPLGRAPDRPADKPQAHYFRSGFSLFGRGARFFAWFRWLLFPILVNQIVRVAQEEKCDYILGIFPDEFYCYAGCMAARRLGLPFSIYLHNTYIDNPMVDQRRGAKIQPEMFAASEFIFVANDGMKRFYEEKYGFRNVITLVATFDKLPQLPAPSGPPLSQRQKIKLVLIGNFNASNMEATKRFVSAVSRDDRYEIYMYTHVPIPLLKMRGLDTSRITHMGYISDSKLVDELQKYDILVLTHGFEGAYGPIEYQTIFPIRTISLLLSGKPMLVHSPRQSYLSDFFRETRAACLVDEPSEELVLEGLNRIVDDQQYAADIAQNARIAANVFHGPRVANAMREALNMTLRERNQPSHAV